MYSTFGFQNKNEYVQRTEHWRSKKNQQRGKEMRKHYIISHPFLCPLGVQHVGGVQHPSSNNTDVMDLFLSNFGRFRRPLRQ